AVIRLQCSRSACGAKVFVPVFRQGQALGALDPHVSVYVLDFR
ncbi:MAG: hypothetical protein RL661_1246, partial [Pseudomonadota bacterium]